MPRSGLRAALLLPPLLLLRAVLAVPLERGAPKEGSPATESPVSGPAPLPSPMIAGGLQPRGRLAPGGGGAPPTDTAILCRPRALRW